MVPKKYVTWQMVEEFIDGIIDTYKDANLTGVYGLPRGGLVFAVMISNRLHIPMLGAPTKGCLVVDDICDTGESLIHYQNNSSGDGKGYLTATMYYKDNRLAVKPDYYMFIKHNDWIVFPWEEKEEKE